MGLRRRMTVPVGVRPALRIADMAAEARPCTTGMQTVVLEQSQQSASIPEEYTGLAEVAAGESRGGEG